jgi:two-component system, NtrC family, response regulator PilR
VRQVRVSALILESVLSNPTKPSAALPKILLVDDEADILELLQLALRKMNLQVDTASSVTQAIEKLNHQNYDLCLTDMRMPDGDGMKIVQHIAFKKLAVPIAVMTAHGNMDNAVSALKAGAFDYLSKPVSLEQLRNLVTQALRLSEAPSRTENLLLGRSPSMQKVHDLIARVARSQAPVHITGESGSGKELASRLIVALGTRAAQPLIAVNCGAIPENLMESEFFGYKKGAFTGADKDRDGFFQAAQGGTLFLDEVADLPLAMQVKLLRVIQEKRVRKVGATTEEAIDVRIISATHSDLAERVKQGKFRQDLYYRLNVISLQMPALRDLREDVLDIAQHTLARLKMGADIHFTDAALRVLQHYDFPGNVRELENIIERALALCSDGLITVEDLQIQDASDALLVEGGGVAPTERYVLQDYLDEIERQALLAALTKTAFNRTAAAKLLGLTLRTIRYRMERLSINAPEGMDDEN